MFDPTGACTHEWKAGYRSGGWFSPIVDPVPYPGFGASDRNPDFCEHSAGRADLCAQVQALSKNKEFIAAQELILDEFFAWRAKRADDAPG